MSPAVPCPASRSDAEASLPAAVSYRLILSPCSAGLTREHLF
ncbi:hypothetical protein GCWU000341_01695 [Oribacterium sp. oral taxon 078 str. F0262]|nr:hypothetical protein GCWU000341_01695 [Oribacterium sp. oral taxon 078 str. F0262]